MDGDSSKTGRVATSRAAVVIGTVGTNAPKGRAPAERASVSCREQITSIKAFTCHKNCRRSTFSAVLRQQPSPMQARDIETVRTRPRFVDLLRRYSIALLVVAAALGIRFALNPYLGENHPYITLYLAVVFAAWYCGLWESVTATAAGMIVANYFWIPPVHSLRIQDPADLIATVTFVLSAAAIIVIG